MLRIGMRYDRRRSCYYHRRGYSDYMRSPESDGYRALSLYRVSTVGDAVSKHAEFLRSLDNAARLLNAAEECTARSEKD